MQTNIAASSGTDGAVSGPAAEEVTRLRRENAELTNKLAELSGEPWFGLLARVAFPKLARWLFAVLLLRQQ